jgi:spore germination protein YaaH
MADLSIPKRQTYPAIRGYVADEDGALDLTTADEVSIILNPATGDPIEITVDPVDPAESMVVSGQTIPVNWTADYASSGLSDTETNYTAKLKITWDSAATPPSVQYCPKDGFIEIDVTANVTEPA